MELNVILDKEYTKKLKVQLENLIDEVIAERLERIKPTKKYYTRKEILDLFKIGMATMEELQARGLKYVKIGKKFYFDIDEIYQILEQMKRK